MACCSGATPPVSKEEEEANKRIQKEIDEEKRRLAKEIKLLLLGAGESGKSTIAKQMKIIHKEGFKESERESYKSIIFNNVIASMRTLIIESERLGIKLSATEVANRILEGTDDFATTDLTPEVAADIKELWNDEGIRQTFEKQSQFQLIDCAEYFLNKIDELIKPGYLPSEQDVLRARAKTTGIIETEFEIEKFKFKMTDVGGQRSERRKWMHCFEGVTAVIFVVAMSEYDLKLAEDNETNRMMESLKLFKDIINSRWFTETSMILFLNKKDLFAEKIKRVPLSVCFADYQGPNTYEDASAYIEKKFQAMNKNPERTIYSHFTCATDTGNVRVVFNAVQDIILQTVVGTFS
jgi:guanine nucleotide-binding protein G(i) subunit alpha